MRGRNEDDPTNLRNAFVAVHLPEEQAIILRAGDLVDRQVGDGLPEPQTAILAHHFRQDAAQAVTDDDHPVEGFVGLFRIEQLAGLPKGLAKR